MRHPVSDIASNPEILDRTVDQTIHPADQMYTGNSQHYFGCGRDAIRKISATLVLTGCTEPASVLDFACGYGRVTRYLRAAFPDAGVVSSDLMAAAVEYNAQTFGVTGHHSTPDLEDVTFDTAFDLIWCGSLMTHLPEEKAVRLLDVFERNLSDNGVAVFTTHGRFVAERRHKPGWPYKIDEETYQAIGERFDNGDYAYADYAHAKGYGISLTPQAWVARHLRGRKGLRCVFFMERGWDDHQDVCALIKKPIV